MRFIDNIKSIFGTKTQTLSATQATQANTKGRKLPWQPRAIFQTKQDIRTWKQAVQLYNSEYPMNDKLQLLFIEIMNDSLLTSQINNRIQQVLSSSFVLKNAKGETDIEATKALQKNPVFRFLSATGLEAIYYGYSLVELFMNDTKQLEAELLPRQNTIPQTGEFIQDLTNTNTIKYRDMAEFGTWILEYNQKNLGLINKAVPHVLMKRFAQACWSELCEIYGIPPRVMKTNTTDATMMSRAEQMMKDMGSAAWFIIDEEETFEFADNVTTKGEVYQYLIQLCNNEMSMLISGAIIGQDTVNGSNAKEKSSQDLLWYLVQDDMKLLEQQWNNINIPALIKHGIVPKGLTFEFEKAEDIDQLFKFTAQAMNSFEVDQTWYAEKFGVKITGAKQTQQTLSARSFFLNAPTTSGAMTNCCGIPHTFKLSGSINNDTLLERFYEDSGERKFDAEIFNFTAKNLSEAFSKGWKKGNKVILAVGIEYGKDDPYALTAYEMNLFRFGGIKTLAESQLLNKAFRESTSFADFKIRASLITKIHNEEWLRTEYNTALSVGETSATYNRLKSQTKLFPYWMYKTVDDNKVRPEHRLLNGLILPADDPAWDKIYPPNGWNCRCYIVPRMKNEIGKQDIEANSKTFQEFINSEEFKKATKSGWGINRAETEQVFTANQQYVSNITEANKMLSELSPADFNIKAPTNEPKVSTNPPEAFDKTQTEYNDYNNRVINISPKIIQEIEGTELISEFQNVIQKPDEVWFQAEKKGESFNQYLYIKQYEGQKIAVRAEYKKGIGLIIKKIFKVSVDAIRWGLLIK